MKRNSVILGKTQRSLRSAFCLSHAGRPRILRTSCSCAASSKPFRKRGFSLASGGHGFCPTDGKNLSSRVCRSHTVAVGRTYALTPPPLYGNILTRGGSFFRKSRGVGKLSAAAQKRGFACGISLIALSSCPLEKDAAQLAAFILVPCAEGQITEISEDRS